ncbi:MAG: hypothetical protein WCC95_17960 [Candidatus Sulfotelmatobacter sp.]
MASGKGNTNAAGILQAIYQATFSDLSTLLANSASPATNLYVSLHTANPGAAGNQGTSEAAYTNYARVAVVRTNVGWTLTGETITNASVINFPASGSGPETETYVGIGLSGSAHDSGTLLWFGALTSSLVVNSGITPSIAASALSITEA